MAMQYTKYIALNVPSGHKIFQHFRLQGPSKYTEIRIFDLKKYHLANLPWSIGKNVV
jgi:hypothetical protein